jgi:hypothetical protein
VLGEISLDGGLQARDRAEYPAADAQTRRLVVWEYLMLLLDKRLSGFVPARFVSFAASGVSGVAVHFFYSLLQTVVFAFPIAQTLGPLPQ